MDDKTHVLHLSKESSYDSFFKTQTSLDLQQDDHGEHAEHDKNKTKNIINESGTKEIDTPREQYHISNAKTEAVNHDVAHEKLASRQDSNKEDHKDVDESHFFLTNKTEKSILDKHRSDTVCSGIIENNAESPEVVMERTEPSANKSKSAGDAVENEKTNDMRETEVGGDVNTESRYEVQKETQDATEIGKDDREDNDGAERREMKDDKHASKETDISLPTDNLKEGTTASLYLQEIEDGIHERPISHQNQNSEDDRVSSKAHSQNNDRERSHENSFMKDNNIEMSLRSPEGEMKVPNKTLARETNEKELRDERPDKESHTDTAEPFITYVHQYTSPENTRTISTYNTNMDNVCGSSDLKTNHEMNHDKTPEGETPIENFKMATKDPDHNSSNKNTEILAQSESMTAQNVNTSIRDSSRYQGQSHIQITTPATETNGPASNALPTSTTTTGNINSMMISRNQTLQGPTPISDRDGKAESQTKQYVDETSVNTDRRSDQIETRLLNPDTNAKEEKQHTPLQVTVNDKNVNEEGAQHFRTFDEKYTDIRKECYDGIKETTVEHAELDQNVNNEQQPDSRNTSDDETLENKDNNNRVTTSKHVIATATTLGKHDNPYFTGRLPTMDPVYPQQGELLSREHTFYRSNDKMRVESNHRALQSDNSQSPAENQTSYVNNIGTRNKFKETHSQKYSLMSHNEENNPLKGKTNMAENKNTNNRTKKPERVPTPSKKIRELIKEIKTPVALSRMSNEEHPTPHDNYISIPLTANHEDSFVTKIDSEREDTLDTVTTATEKSFNLGKTKLKIGDINALTSNVMGESYAREYEEFESKFDNLPQIKVIDKYRKDELLNERPMPKRDHKKSVDKTTNDESIQTGRISENKVQVISEQSATISKIPSKHENTATIVNIPDNTAARNWKKFDRDNELYRIKKSSEEKDLKAMIASAKQAFDPDRELPETAIVREKSNISRKVIVREESPTQEKRVNVTPDENEKADLNIWKTDTQSCSNVETLICSDCLQMDTNVDVAGFCAVCQKYMCGDCTDKHKNGRKTKHHEILKSYCVNELKINKYKKATGYCSDCQHFLCSKCVILHTGYRSYRHHRIIQSSFVSHPPAKKAASSSDSVLDSTLNTTDISVDDMKLEKLERKQKQRKRILKEFSQQTHYRSPAAKNISQSVYPGSNEKLGISYASNPSWPHSSIPALPYLVQPKSMQERSLQVPYLMHHRSPFYMNTKAALDPHTVKLRALQARYDSQKERRIKRRKENGLFTARPLTRPDQFSLPDIRSMQSYTTGSKTQFTDPNIKRYATVTNKLKTAKYVEDHCLSIPFPSNEQVAVISGMTILYSGKLVVTDSRNNNIKLYNRRFTFIAALPFLNRLVDICASNLNPSDVYVATPKHIYEIIAKKALDIQRKIKIEMRRIEGITCWKYGLATISRKTNLTWELRLLDYRGNSKCKLEILNPFACDIESSVLYHMTTTKGGSCVTVTDRKNSCLICVDVTTRCVQYETAIENSTNLGYLTSDNQHNVYVSCKDKVFQISKKGENLGTVVTMEASGERFGSIVYNRTNDRIYVQTAPDIISVYKFKS